MRIDASGLEVEIVINKEKLKRLSSETLEGVMKFFDEDETRRDIPASIRVDKNQEDYLKVEQIPRKVYFGCAEKINFVINSEFYAVLSNNLSFGERFYGSVGKLIMRVNDS